jgi:hypothetical protein
VDTPTSPVARAVLVVLLVAFLGMSLVLGRGLW